jgi:hypothetical protein
LTTYDAGATAEATATGTSSSRTHAATRSATDHRQENQMADDDKTFIERRIAVDNAADARVARERGERYWVIETMDQRRADAELINRTQNESREQKPKLGVADVARAGGVAMNTNTAPASVRLSDLASEIHADGAKLARIADDHDDDGKLSALARRLQRHADKLDAMVWEVDGLLQATYRQED